MLHLGGMNIQMKLNSLPLENLLKFGGDLRILTGHDLRLIVKNGDSAAETAEHLTELEPDVSSPENDQMLGQILQLHHAFIRENAGRVESRNFGDDRAATRVDENLFGFEKSFAQSNLVRTRELGLPLVEMYIRMQPDFLLHSAAETRDHVVFLRNDRWKISAHILGANTPARGIPRIVRDLPPRDHRFCGRAPRIDARAADVSLFDQCDFPPYFGEPVGERISRLARTDDDRIVSHGRRLLVAGFPTQYLFHVQADYTTRGKCMDNEGHLSRRRLAGNSLASNVENSRRDAGATGFYSITSSRSFASTLSPTIASFLVTLPSTGA